MRYQDKKVMLAMAPPDWERIAEQVVQVSGKRALRYVRYDQESFGSCIVILRYRFVLIRFIKDRSDEWVDIKSVMGWRWIPLPEFVGKKADGSMRLKTMFDSVMYLENTMLAWHRKKWYSISSKLLSK